MTKMDDVGKRTYYTGMSAVLDEDNQTYFHYDHLGNTRLITDKEGNIVKNISYAAYGKPTDSSGNEFNTLSLKDFPYLFVGNSGIVYDHKTQLHNMRFRWFSSKIMRFLSPDILEDINRYSYAGGNPVNYVDIFGLWYVYYENGNIYAVPTNTGDDKYYLEKVGYTGQSLKSFTKYGMETFNITSNIKPIAIELFEEQYKNNKPGYFNCFGFVFAYEEIGDFPDRIKNLKKGKSIYYDKQGKKTPIKEFSVMGGNIYKTEFVDEGSYDRIATKEYIVHSFPAAWAKNHKIKTPRVGDVVIINYGTRYSPAKYKGKEYHANMGSFHSGISLGLDNYFISKTGFPPGRMYLTTLDKYLFDVVKKRKKL